MFRIARVDNRDFMLKSRRLERNIMLFAGQTAPVAVDVVAAEVRRDLTEKILRPRESEGLLASEITGVVLKQGNNLIMGVGEIDRLNARVPYWRLQDEGGMGPNRYVPGYFVDESGKRVDWRPNATAMTIPPKQSMDLFIYTPSHGWVEPGDYLSIIEAGQHGGPIRMIMYVNRPIPAKRFFEGGELAARRYVISLFDIAFRMAFT